MPSFHPEPLRHSAMSYGSIYFWTATINYWQHLLEPDDYKDVVIDSLRNLSERRLVDVFGFVVMPNHIHLVWRPLQPNGKETPQGSLLKFTAHAFKKMLANRHGLEALASYAVQARDRHYEFWQRDPMAIWLYSRPVAFQKLDYTHRNPAAERWKLVIDPVDYLYSSAAYYATGIDHFGFLKNLHEEVLR